MKEEDLPEFYQYIAKLAGFQTPKTLLPLVLKTCNTLCHVIFLQRILEPEKTTQALSVD